MCYQSSGVINLYVLSTSMCYPPPCVIDLVVLSIHLHVLSASMCCLPPCVVCLHVLSASMCCLPPCVIYLHVLSTSMCYLSCRSTYVVIDASYKPSSIYSIYVAFNHRACSFIFKFTNPILSLPDNGNIMYQETRSISETKCFSCYRLIHLCSEISSSTVIFVFY